MIRKPQPLFHSTKLIDMTSDVDSYPLVHSHPSGIYNPVIIKIVVLDSG